MCSPEKERYPVAEMDQHCILVVDDDPKIRTLLGNVFEGAGYRVSMAQSADEALALVKSDKPDLVTLDLQLGREDGLDVARSIQEISTVPIIMVTGRDDIVDRVVGLELGADDYITKPFHVREVLARVRSVIRRAGKGKGTPGAESTPVTTRDSPAFTFDGLTIVPERFELFDRNGDPCDLTSGDFKLLSVFLERAKRILSRDQLMDLTGGIEWTPLDRTIDNQVARLRKKIERDPANPKIIKTVRGIGYSFACDVAQVQPPLSPKSA